MGQRHLRPLGLVLRDYLRGMGFDWRACTGEAPRPAPWSRPPLVTDLELAGRPLQPYIAAPCRLSAADMVDVYERFIAGYIQRRTFHDHAPNHWLRRQLRVEREHGRRLFTEIQPGSQRLSLHLNLVQVAALAHYNCPSALEEGPDTFKVTTLPDFYVFGVKEGELVTNSKRQAKKVPVRFLRSETGNLQTIARGWPGYGASGVAERILPWAKANRKKLGDDYEAVLMALSILYWRKKEDPFQALRDLTYRERTPKAWAAALKEAFRHREMADPAKSLMRIFVPQFMPADEFRQAFTNADAPTAGVVSEAMAQKWDRVLRDLEAEVKLLSDYRNDE
jgi:hypothetical protein